MARAAVRRPGVAFKGGRARLGNRGPGTGRGRGRGAAAGSACPAPRPLDRGWRPGRAVARRREGGWGRGRGAGREGPGGPGDRCGDTPGPPGPQPNHSPPSASWGPGWGGDGGEPGPEKMGDPKAGGPAWLLSEFQPSGRGGWFHCGEEKESAGSEACRRCLTLKREAAGLQGGSLPNTGHRARKALFPGEARARVGS